MKMKGRSDYASGLPSPHPFYQKCPGIYARSLIFLGMRNRRWQWLTVAGLVLVLCNILIIYWLSSIRQPVVYVDTVLKSGQLYQTGILNRPPLSKSQSKAILVSHQIKRDHDAKHGQTEK